MLASWMKADRIDTAGCPSTDPMANGTRAVSASQAHVQVPSVTVAPTVVGHVGSTVPDMPPLTQTY